MFLRQKSSGHMVEVVDVTDLFNLYHDEIFGRFQEGEEVQDPEPFKKQDLTFLSGEELPQCWLDPHYRDAELKRRLMYMM